MISNPIPWPDGAQCACALTFDMDADSLIHVARPEDGHDRLYPISMGKYGPQVAVPRILETYRNFGIKQSFFIPAWCMEQYPETIDAILKDGHEIGHHGYVHENPTDHGHDEQIYWFDRALAVHQKMTGRDPRGYRAPVYNMTQGVVDLLIQRGLLYDSSLMGDDIPYRLQTSEGSVLEIPVHWGTDDWPPFAHYEEIGYMMPVQAPSVGLNSFFEEFEAHYEAGGLWMPILHPFLTGRLARWRVMQNWLEGIMRDRKVWFAPLEEIARYIATLEERGEHQVRTDTLPYYTRPVLLDRKG